MTTTVCTSVSGVSHGMFEWSEHEFARAICRPAAVHHDYLQSFRCLYENYHRSGLCAANATGLRIQPFQLWPQTQMFVCTVAGRICGTVSLVIEGEHSLPAETFFPNESCRIRSTSRKIAELTCLAISPGQQRSHPDLFAQLTSTAIHFARTQDVDTVLATVHPRHAKIYKRVMGFDQIGDIAPHSGVLGNPAALVLTDINDPSRVAETWRDWYVENRFAEGELSATEMPEASRIYFESVLQRGFGVTSSRRRKAVAIS